MRHECPPTEALAEILVLDPSDPRRVELESCPHCAARLLSFGSFLEPGDPPPEANLSDARRRILQALASAQDRETMPNRERGPRARRSFLILPNWFGWKPALALAGTLAVAAIVLHVTGVRSPRSPMSERVVRGPALPAASMTKNGTRLLPATFLPNGGCTLRWTRVENGDAYVVVFHWADLSEVLRLPVRSDTFLTLSPDDVRRLGHSGEAMLWRVSVLSKGDEIFASTPGVMRIP